MGHVKEQPNPDDRLLEKILSRDNLITAWKQVKANDGAPGIDGITIEGFPAVTRPHWHEILESLMTGAYQPLAVLRVEIPKPTGGTRPLGIPCILDRLIQQAIAQVLGPIFDPTFSESSFGFRPGRSAHDAVYQVRRYIQQGYTIAVDMDLSKFFDTVQHDVLMHRLSRKIRDKRVLRLIGKYLRAGVMIDGRLQETRVGVPQGGPLSPLLSNIVLDDLDKELEKRGHRFARYADDFVILVKSRRAGERVSRSLQRYLERTLKLKVNQDKSKVAPTDQIIFLGFTFRGTKIRWSEKAFREFKRRVKLFTGRSWFVSMDYRLEKLAEYLRGWMRYFGIAEYYRPIPEIDPAHSGATAPSAHVLLEAVAKTTHKGARASEAWHIPYRCHPGGPQSKRPMAPCPDTGNPNRHDQPMASRAGTSVCQRAVGKHPLPGYGPVNSVNRPVRTRMPGGVGAGGRKTPGYPIRKCVPRES